LKTCPNCTTELVIDGGDRCPVCNQLLSETPQGATGATDDDLPFEVTEAHDDHREIVGGIRHKSSRDDLGIENEADITASQSKKYSDSGMSEEHRQSLDDEPVHFPSPALPVQPPKSAASKTGHAN